MSDSTSPPLDGGDQAEPTEEELRAYMAELRSADAADLVAQVQSMIINAVQVKLGRNDARLLIDLSARINDHVRGTLTEELTGQVDDVVAQLRMAQVEAEKEAAQLRSQGQLPDLEPNDLPRDGATGAAPAATGDAPAPTSTPPEAPGSRLWTPGT